ncbi:MAG: hypothetical protein CFE33_19565 [Pseudorhodobacter sp. PARRP1]|nr:MAG: hypothetical protein CFE33_19565 [Pseudorhodobacter sp. PARRP1]
MPLGRVAVDHIDLLQAKQVPNNLSKAELHVSVFDENQNAVASGLYAVKDVDNGIQTCAHGDEILWRHSLVRSGMDGNRTEALLHNSA